MTRAAALLCLFAALQIGAARATEPVKLGYYGPAEADHPVGGTAWLGVTLAIEEANAEGGYGGQPFELVQEWDENPWSGGAAGVVRMVYSEGVTGIIGSINGDATHLAEQVVAKALVPLVDPLSTDASVNAAFVPWTFSVLPDDAALMKPLVQALGDSEFVLVTSTAHDPRLTAKALFAHLGRRRPVRHVQFERPDGVAADVAGLDCGTVVVLASAADSARLVRELRALRPRVRIFGGHVMASRTFAEAAGPARDGVTFPVPATIDGEFERRFRERFGVRPDYGAASTYDAAMLLVAAVREAGAEREAVRDAVEGLAPYEGVSGTVRWSSLRRNVRECGLRTIGN